MGSSISNKQNTINEKENKFWKECNDNFYLFKNESDFWEKYYIKTGNYSVGPAATITLNNNINKINKENSNKILKKFKII